MYSRRPFCRATEIADRERGTRSNTTHQVNGIKGGLGTRSGGASLALGLDRQREIRGIWVTRLHPESGPAIPRVTDDTLGAGVGGRTGVSRS